MNIFLQKQFQRDRIIGTEIEYEYILTKMDTFYLPCISNLINYNEFNFQFNNEILNH